MSLAQKFRGFITSTAPAAVLATTLAVLPLFNGNAQAQEPMRTSHTPQSSNATKHYQPTLIELADDYSVNNKAVGIIVYKGKKDEGGLTGPQIGGMIKNYFDGEAITSKPFVGPSTADYTTIGYMVKGILYGPVSLGEAKSMAVVAASGYDDAYGTHLNKRPVSAAMPSNSRE